MRAREDYMRFLFGLVITLAAAPRLPVFAGPRAPATRTPVSAVVFVDHDKSGGGPGEGWAASWRHPT